MSRVVTWSGCDWVCQIGNSGNPEAVVYGGDSADPRSWESEFDDDGAEVRRIYGRNPHDGRNWFGARPYVPHVICDPPSEAVVYLTLDEATWRSAASRTETMVVSEEEGIVATLYKFGDDSALIEGYDMYLHVASEDEIEQVEYLFGQFEEFGGKSWRVLREHIPAKGSFLQSKLDEIQLGVPEELRVFA